MATSENHQFISKKIRRPTSGNEFYLKMVDFFITLYSINKGGPTSDDNFFDCPGMYNYVIDPLDWVWKIGTKQTQNAYLHVILLTSFA